MKCNLVIYYHITDFITGTFQDLENDFERVVLTKGEFLGLQDPIITTATGGIFNIVCDDNSNQGNAKPTDS